MQNKVELLKRHCLPSFQTELTMNLSTSVFCIVSSFSVMVVLVCLSSSIIVVFFSVTSRLYDSSLRSELFLSL